MDTLLIVIIVFAFFFVTLTTFGIIIWVMWSRRKYIVTKFLDRSGKWEVVYNKQITPLFTYDGSSYEFDLKLCTRDKVNRPVAEYYKGNMKQIHHDLEKMDTKFIKINQKDVDGSQITSALKTKIWQDIFGDDELQMYLIIIMIEIFVFCGIIIILVATKKTPTEMGLTNQSINVIKSFCLSRIPA